MDISGLNEQFQYNLMLAKALVQLMPASERQIIRIWFDKLSELDRDEEDMITRNEYIWFILLMLQNNKIVSFFKMIPPEDLPPLKSAIPEEEFDEVMIASDQNMSWLDNVDDEKEEKRLNKRKVPPFKFLKSQPVPKEGIFCYFGAFSDQN